MLTTDKDTKTPKISEQQQVTIGDQSVIIQGNCPHLLPCGVCTKTNQICPLGGWHTTQPIWTVNNTCDKGGK